MATIINSENQTYDLNAKNTKQIIVVTLHVHLTEDWHILNTAVSRLIPVSIIRQNVAAKKLKYLQVRVDKPTLTLFYLLKTS
jgi:hypothetical protein